MYRRRIMELLPGHQTFVPYRYLPDYPIVEAEIAAPP
jgi:hypothetical protein